MTRTNYILMRWEWCPVYIRPTHLIKQITYTHILIHNKLPQLLQGTGRYSGCVTFTVVYLAIYLILTRLRSTGLSALYSNKHLTRYQVSVSHVRFFGPKIFGVPMKGPRAQTHRAAHIYLFLLILNLLEVSS